jgi:hypothetical protein
MSTGPGCRGRSIIVSNSARNRRRIADQDGEAVSLDRDICLVEPTQLLRSGMDMHQGTSRRRRGDQAELECRAVVQSRADDDQKIGRASVVVRNRRSTEAEIADIIRVIVGKQSLAAEGNRDR